MLPDVYESSRLYTWAMITMLLCETFIRTPSICNHAMRTNIVIDEALMRQAMQASGARSKREAVELGLRILVRLQQQGEIRAYRGQMQWEGDLDAQRFDADLEKSGPGDLEQDRL
jgi:Arc/MetJ family transcription regulator